MSTDSSSAPAASSTAARLALVRRVRVIGICAVLIAVLAAAGLSLATAGGSPRLMVRATFDDAGPLLEGNDVRLGGVKVGEVATITIAGRDAEVLIELDEKALPVYEDATLTIRPVSLLGERYVELKRGTPETPRLSDGAELPVEATGSSTDLDEVLNAVDQPTGEALAILLNTLGGGLNGNGENLDEALGAIAPALVETGELTGVLSEQNATLASLVTSLEAVAGSLSVDEGRQLDQLVGAADDLLAVTRTNEAAFRAMLTQLPGTLNSARTTLEALTNTADATTPLLTDLRPTTDDLTEISQELLAFADAAYPALGSLNTVLSYADDLLAQAAPVAATLRVAAPSLTADAAALDPLTRELAGDFTTIMEFFKGWALATNGRDGLAHYFRAGLVVTDYSVTGVLPTGTSGLENLLGLGSGATSGEPSTAPAAPADGATPPPSAAPLAPGSDSSAATPPDLLGGLGSAVGSLGGGLLAPQRTADGGVTGLDASQERGVLGFLLGGN